MDVETLTVDAEEQAMRDLGHETDVAQGRPVETETPETPKTPPAPEAEPETPEPQPPETEQPEELQPAAETETKEGRPRDPVTGKFQKPDTEYSRAQKEAARKERSWQALQAEKEQFRMAQTQWEEQQRMAQLEQTRRQYQPLKQEGLTAQEYYQGAVRFEQEGDHENALKAYKVASELGRAEQTRYQQMQAVEAEYQWRKQMEEVSQAYPQIWEQPIAGHLQRIIAENGEWLYRVPGGFKRAAEVAHMLTQIQSLKEKDDEIIRLRAELEKGQRKSQPGKSGYASPRTDEKDFDSMDLNEMESHLKGLTAEADNYR